MKIHTMMKKQAYGCGLMKNIRYGNIGMNQYPQTTVIMVGWNTILMAGGSKDMLAIG